VDLESGLPVWLLRDPAPASAWPDLAGSLDCDVVVVGAGITGALAAWHLVQAGLDVVVLDRRPVGLGSTVASTSLIQYELDTSLLELRTIVGRERADRSYRVCVDAVRRLGEIVREVDSRCGYEPRASLYLASNRDDADALRQEAAARREIGIAVDDLTPADIAARFPFRRPAALLSKDAAQIDAYRLANDLIDAAAALGARVFTGPGATMQALRPGGGVALGAAGGAVTARHVVLATGYESQASLRAPIATLSSTYAIATAPDQPLAEWDGRCLIWESARPYCYLRTTTEGRVIIGGEDEQTADPARRDALLAVKSARLAVRGREMFPSVDFAPACAWAGTFAGTHDGLPFIGAPAGLPDIWFALGYGGNGITFGLIAAEIVRDACLGRVHHAADLFGFDR
jgi:glycine/D-amino acid oxidase-like deaminating enzyme